MALTDFRRREMKLREVKINPENTYVSEFFEEVAKTDEGKFFRFEGPETVSLRSAARIYGSRLGRKFSVREVKDGDTKFYAVGVTSKIRKRAAKKSGKLVDIFEVSNPPADCIATSSSVPPEVLCIGAMIIGDPETPKSFGDTQI